MYVFVATLSFNRRQYDLFLYTPAGGTPLAESRSPGSAPEEIVKAVGAGRYIVRVNPFLGRSAAPYRLTATWQ